MSIFSKSPCIFCQKPVGFIKGTKIKDGNRICNECAKNCSAFISFSNFDTEALRAHVEYMKMQEVLYQKEFKTLAEHEIYQANGLNFADKIGMFEVSNGQTKAKNFHQLFRYDQILNFQAYQIENPQKDEHSYKYSETGIEITLQGHPYVLTLKVKTGGYSNDASSARLAKNYLNGLFGRSSESFVDTVKETVGGVVNFANMQESAAGGMRTLNFLAESVNRAECVANVTEQYAARYTDAANQAQARAWAQ